MTGQLRFELPDFESVLIRPYQGLVRQSAGSPTETFSKALESLPNVKVLRHEPGFLFDPDWGCRWRNIYLHPWALLGYTSDSEDEDMEALQLSVALRTLAIVRRRQIRMESIKMYVGGPSFWGPNRLQRLWFDGNHERTRTLRSLYCTATEADRGDVSDYSDPEQMKLYLYQLCYIKQALTSLTQLDCSVSEDEEWNGLAIARNYLYEYILSPTRSLERIRLVFGRLVDGILLPGDDSPRYAKASLTLLDQLASHTPWKKIRSIELEITTDGPTLKRFLFAHKATLRSLTLTRVTLLRVGDPRNTWELVLKEIMQTLQLSTLCLVELCEFVPQQGNEGIRRRMLFNADAETWQGKATQYAAYYEATIDCLLRGDSVQLM